MIPLDIEVERSDLTGTWTSVSLPLHRYQTRSCPICGDAADSDVIASVEGEEGAGLESSFCTLCEHRYLSRLPDGEWFESYYAEDFDSPDAEARSPLAPALDALRWARGAIRDWGTGDEEPLRVQQMRPMVFGVAEAARSHFLRNPDVDRVLEVGCGTGGTLAWFQENGFAAYGVEANKHRVATCRERGLDVRYSGTDGLDPVAGEAPFDLAYSTHVLEHVLDPRDHLEEISGMVRDGGFLYLEVPSLNGGEHFVHQSHTPVHCHTFTPGSLCRLVREFGFQVVRLQMGANVHLLARKGDHGLIPEISDTGEPRHLVEHLERLAKHGDAPLRLRYDHASVEVTRRDTGAMVYERDSPFEVEPMDREDWVGIDFRITKSGTKDPFPVRFRYGASDPPLWVTEK